MFADIHESIEYGVERVSFMFGQGAKREKTRFMALTDSPPGGGVHGAGGKNAAVVNFFQLCMPRVWTG